MPQWRAWATQTFLELAKEMNRPVEAVLFHRAADDWVEVVVHSRGTTGKYLLNFALCPEDPNRRDELQKELKGLRNAFV